MKMQATAARQEWALPPDVGHSADALLGCLVHITGLHGKPWSADALVTGLPLSAEGLTPELFQRAAARAGLSVQMMRRPLESVCAQTLPAVLLLHERQACVLVAKH